MFAFPSLLSIVIMPPLLLSIVIMPPTSKNLRRHVGLGLSVPGCMRASVRGSHFANGQERLEIVS